MRLENLAIGVVIFGVFTTLGFLLVFNQSNNYDLNTDTDIFSNFTGIQDETPADADELREDIQIRRSSEDDSEVVAYKQSYPGTLNIFGWFTLTGRTLNSITQETGLIPPFIKTAFITIIVILAAVFGLYMFRGFKPHNN